MIKVRKNIVELLQLRRSIDRKILLKQSWSYIKIIKYRTKMFLLTKNIKSFFIQNDQKIYHFLNRKIKQITNLEHNLVNIPQITISPVDNIKNRPAWFNELKKYHEKLLAEDSLIIIQGSYADGKITNFSDIDLVIFYVPYNPKVLAIKEEIETLLLKIDPLQHHGVFMIDKNTFDYYWQMDLPVGVIQKAKCFSNKPIQLPITKRIDENTSSLRAVYMTLNTISEFIIKDFNSIGVWRWKFFLSQLMLLPTLVLASQGEYVYKRNSFEKAKDLYTVDAWYCITKSTAIREQWPVSDFFKDYINFRTNASEDIIFDNIKAASIQSISVADDKKFYKSLQLMIFETKNILKK